MKKIVHYIGLDVHKETIALSVARGEAVAGNRYTRCARPAEPESAWMIYWPETQGGSFLATLGFGTQHLRRWPKRMSTTVADRRYMVNEFYAINALYAFYEIYAINASLGELKVKNVKLKNQKLKTINMKTDSNAGCGMRHQVSIRLRPTSARRKGWGVEACPGRVAWDRAVQCPSAIAALWRDKRFKVQSRRWAAGYVRICSLMFG